MARVKVPGLKASEGIKPFEPIPGGTYKIKVLTVSINDPKSGGPLKVWKFAFVVDKADDPDLKGRRLWDQFNILEEIHPDYEKNAHWGIDQLKSMCLCFGVSPRGDDVDPEAFIGLTGKVDVVIKMEENQAGEMIPRNRITRWYPQPKATTEA